MLLDDIRKTLEATFSNLSPSKAQELAKGLMEPGAAKDQIAKTAAELIEWSQGNRERLAAYIREEIRNQMSDDGRGDALGPGFGEEAGPRARACRGHDRLRTLRRQEGHDPEALRPRRSAPRGSPRPRRARPRARRRRPRPARPAPASTAGTSTAGTSTDG